MDGVELCCVMWCLWCSEQDSYGAKELCEFLGCQRAPSRDFISLETGNVNTNMHFCNAICLLYSVLIAISAFYCAQTYFFTKSTKNFAFFCLSLFSHIFLWYRVLFGFGLWYLWTEDAYLLMLLVNVGSYRCGGWLCSCSSSRVSSLFSKEFFVKDCKRWPLIIA